MYGKSVLIAYYPGYIARLNAVTRVFFSPDDTLGKLLIDVPFEKKLSQ